MNETSDWVLKERVAFHQILSLFVLFTITLSTIFGNIVVIIAILKTPKLRIRSNYLILSLSVTDLMVGLTLMPVSAIIDIIYYSEWIFGALFCDLYIIFYKLLTGASAFHLVFIAVDRYLSVTRIEYSLSKKNRYVVAMVCISWVSALLISLTAIMGWRDYQSFLDRIRRGICLPSLKRDRQIFNLLATFFIPIIIMIVGNIKIYLKSKEFLMKYENYRKLNKRNGTKSENTSNQNSIEMENKTSDIGSNATEEDKRIKTIRREVKVAKTLSIITMAYIICFLPITILDIMTSFTKQKKYIKLGFDITIWLVFTNSMINPILYSYFNHNFKKAFNDILISWKFLSR